MTTLYGNATSVRFDQLDLFPGAVTVANPTTYRIENGATYDEFESYGLAPFAYDPGSGQLNGGTISFWRHYLSDGTLVFMVALPFPYPATALEDFRAGDDTAGFLAELFNGFDVLNGSSADDYLNGYAGGDYLLGNDGNDTLIGGSGSDELGGGTGADVMIGGADSDSYYVDDPADTIIEEVGGGDADAVHASFDTLALANGVENLYLAATAAVGAGNDLDNTINAYSYVDVANRLSGKGGNDVIHAEGGDDTLQGGAGNDTLYGGKGVDLVDLSDATAAITVAIVHSGTFVVLDVSKAGLGLDTYLDAEGLIGGNFADTLTGSTLDDVLHGGAGGDSLIGGAGDDTLQGGAGNDTLKGDAGIDLLDLGGGTTAIAMTVAPGGPSGTIDLTAIGLGVDSYSALEGVLGTPFNDTLTGTGGNDLLGGAAGDDSLAGAGGDDTLGGGAGNDSLDGGTGLDLLDLSDAGAGVSLTLAQSAANTALDLTAVGLGKDAYKNMEGIVGSQFGDTLTGSASADLLQGGAGLDSLYGGNGNDTLEGNDDWNVLNGEIGNDSLLGGSFFNELSGDAGSDTLAGGDTWDTLDGGTGADSMAGGHGDDTYYVDNVGDVVQEVVEEQTPGGPVDSNSDQVNSTIDIAGLFDHVERLTLLDLAIVGVGNALDNIIVGTDQANKLSGLDGGDNLMGGAGADTLDGGDGGDSLVGDAGADSLVGGVGDDWMRGGDDNDTLVGGDGNDHFYGDAGTDSFVGGAGNDVFEWGVGPDIMVGGIGDDAYFIDDAGDVVTEVPGEGIDFVDSLIDIPALSAGIENVILSGIGTIGVVGNDANNNFLGNTGANRLDGKGGNDTLNGDVGNDTLIGGTGDDTYKLDFWEYEFNDVIVEKANEGTDTLLSAVSVLALADNVENLTLFGSFYIPSKAVEAVGNKLDNIITGDASSNYIAGLEGNDTLHADSGNDTVLGGSGNDFIDDLTGDDSMQGGDGDDTLHGALGNDTVDAGIGADLITTGSGNDSVQAGDGNDSLESSDGNDTLDGGTGADTLTGGEGDDLYFQDSAGDFVTESGTTVNDELRTNQVLSTAMANIEHYLFSGSVGIDFTATSLANRVTATNESDKVDGLAGNDTLTGLGGNDTLIGGLGNDELDGGAGVDSLIGAAGNDVYWVDDPGDVISDTGGFDALVSETSVSLLTGQFAAIEEVFLLGADDLAVTGSSVSNRLVGNDGNNTLSGVTGNDTLDGWIGNDSLDGGVGIDLLLGFDGDDTLGGGAGNDGLAGEQGNDLLLGGAGADIYGFDPFFDGADRVHTGDNGVDHVILFGSLWDWDFDRIGNDLLIGALVDPSDFYDESRTIRIVDHYAGASIAYFDADFGVDGNLFYGGNPNFTRVYTPGTMTGRNQGANAELIAGTAGNDKIVGNGGQSDWLFGGGGNDSVMGGSTANGAAWLFGNAGNDTLGGGVGNNQMSGGDGDDLYIVDSVGDVVNELGSDANDELRTNQALSVIIPDIEHYTFTGAIAVNFTADGAANRLTGTARNDTLVGGAGDDTLNGGTGADSLAGGIDDDTYVVDNAKDVVDESSGGGTDKVQSTIAYVLAAGLENLELLGTAAVNGTGNADANWITGNKGANKLDGMGGADTLEGRGGNDTYIVGAGDQVLEIIAGAAGGVDLVLSAVSFDLSLAGREQVEKLTLTGGALANIDATGNALANTLTGNAGNNKLDGRAGADRMAGGLGDDTYVVDLKTDIVTEAAKAGADTVQTVVSYVLGANLENLVLLLDGGNIDGTGNAFDNEITGNAGNNKLDGKAGADLMMGGLGNDTYVIDNLGDVADESGGGGIDTLVTPFATVLAPDFENLTLTGAAAVAGTGNALANIILGNSGANALSGEGNNDSLAGAAGNDSLDGGAGNDTLDGGVGADKLAGGAGADTYIVDNAKDVVTEAADSGIDTVKSSVTHILAAEVENLTLTGAGAINGTGNGLANMIVGNAAANILSGGAGNDTLDGGKGNDKLTGGDGSDHFLHHSLAEGKDTITDFQTGPGGDVLDIADLLVGYSAGHEAEFVQLVLAAGNTTVKVDADGLANGAKFTDVCVLTGVTTDLPTLVTDGNLLLT